MIEPKKIQCINKMGSSDKIYVQFKLGVDDWEICMGRLEFYFEALDIADDKKRAVLLAKVEIETYSLLRNLSAPQKLKDLTYTQFVPKLNELLAPPPSETAERAKFAAISQKAGIKIAEFVAEFKLAARHCKFTNDQERLRDQFSAGVYKTTTKIELFRQTNTQVHKIGHQQMKNKIQQFYDGRLD